MWTQAEHIREWWGPDGFSVGAVESDPRPGGALTIVMVGPDFEETMRARYAEVDEGRRIVVESVVHTQEGEPFIDSSHTVTFRDLGDQTEVTVAARASVFDSAGLGALAGMRAGWSQSLQCLDDAVRGTLDRQIVADAALRGAARTRLPDVGGRVPPGAVVGSRRVHDQRGRVRSESWGDLAVHHAWT